MEWGDKKGSGFFCQTSTATNQACSCSLKCRPYFNCLRLFESTLYKSYDGPCKYLRLRNRCLLVFAYSIGMFQDRKFENSYTYKNSDIHMRIHGYCLLLDCMAITAQHKLTSAQN